MESDDPIWIALKNAISDIFTPTLLRIDDPRLGSIGISMAIRRMLAVDPVTGAYVFRRGYSVRTHGMSYGLTVAQKSVTFYAYTEKEAITKAQQKLDNRAGW